MYRQVHVQDRILSSFLAQVIKKIDPGPVHKANAQMYGMLGGHSGTVRLPPRDKQDIAGCHLDLLVRRQASIELIRHFDGMQPLRVPDAPRFVSVNLQDQDVVDVPMRPERAALGEAEIGIYLGVNSHFSLDGCRELTDLGNEAMNEVHNDADALR